MRDVTTAMDYVKLTCLEDVFMNNQANTAGKGSLISLTDNMV